MHPASSEVVSPSPPIKPVETRKPEAIHKPEVTGRSEATRNPEAKPIPVPAAKAASQPERASDALDWSNLAYRLELDRLVAQVAINSVVHQWADNRLQLAHLPELDVMIKPETGQQIRRALESSLGVELALEFVAQPKLASETPYQARLRAEAEAHRQAIAAIRQDPTVQQLNALFGAELIENTVKKIND